MNGSVSWVLELKLIHFTVQAQVLWAIKDTSCLFSESVFSPREKHFLITHLPNYISLPHCTVCQRGQATACTVLKHSFKKKKKRLHLWETNQPFPNYMPLFRQMKSLINAAILEKQLLLHLFWLCLNMCYKKGRVDDIFMISSVCWKNPFLKTNLLSDQKFNVFLNVWKPPGPLMQIPKDIHC